MKILFETKRYAFAWDNLMGVGRFIRQSDGAVSLLETGSDADELKQTLTEFMTEETRENKIPGSEFFDGIADQMEYE